VTFQEFFDTNRILFYSVYGQVFFVLGLAIALSARQDTKVPLAKSLWLLSTFGFLHAFYEWSYVILPVQKGYVLPETYRLLEILQRILEAFSFAFLFQFGTAVVELSRPSRWLRYLAPALFLLWLAVYLYAVPPLNKEFKSTSDLADAWARYLLCLPGACLSAYGLLLQTKEAKAMGVQQIERQLKLAAFSFLLYALVAGLLVPPAAFFPAAWLNRRLLSTYVGIPPPVARAAAGMLITYFMIRSLEVFKIELRRLLEDAVRIQALAQDRERISRDLHDGILQHLYGAGLHLEKAIATCSQNTDTTTTLIQKAIQLLNRGMRDIRNYIFDLNWDAGMDLETKLKDLLERNSNGGEPEIRFETLGSTTSKLPSSMGLHLYHFVQEAISNARKHARAKNLWVTLAYGEDALKITIKDDGVGFVLDQARQNGSKWQQGLKNMERRADLLGGKLEIETEPGTGTRVNLTLYWEARSHERGH
jgi:signal transduction histidine kinase